jgi:pimeloyl-ACP methyl ester carboxylesterase
MRHILLFLFLLALPALACSLDDEDEDDLDVGLPPTRPLVVADPADALSGSPVFAPSDCPFDMPSGENLRCGYVSVPETRGGNDGRLVHLAVVVIPSRSSSPLPDPVVYLSGGPGDTAVGDLASWLNYPLRDRRDIILFDQRGTGFSQPHLGCPEMNEVDDDADEDAMFDAARACRNRLARSGINLAAYNSAASAADLHAVRQALGYVEWNLIGVSYGTRLALTAMRDYPQGIRSVVLDSVYPPNANAYSEQPLHIANAIEGMLAGCAAQAACNRAYPDLRDKFYELLEYLEESPVEFDDDWVLDAQALLDDLTQALYDSGAILFMPYALDEAYYENYDPLIELLSEEEFDDDFVDDEDWYFEDDAEDLFDSEGAYYSVECYESVYFGDLDDAWELVADFPAVLAEILYWDLEGLYQICDIWDLPAPDARESEAVRSDIPTLLLAGEYDPVTPPAWAHLAARTLSRSYVFVAPAAGHALIDLNDCTMQMIIDFINNPQRSPDGSCLTRPAFVLP